MNGSMSAGMGRSPVAYLHDNRRSVGVRFDGNDRFWSGVLDGVPRHVGESFRQAIGVPRACHVAFDLQLDGRVEFVDDVSADLTQVGGLHFDRQAPAKTSACEVERLRDHSSDAVAAADDAGGGLRVAIVKAPTLDKLGGGQDARIERATQIVPENTDEHLPQLA